MNRAFLVVATCFYGMASHGNVYLPEWFTGGCERHMLAVSYAMLWKYDLRRPEGIVAAADLEHAWGADMSEVASAPRGAAKITLGDGHLDVKLYTNFRTFQHCGHMSVLR